MAKSNPQEIQDFQKNHLIGIREFDGIVFVILNSAWFSSIDSKKDEKNLWIGRNFIAMMSAVVSFPPNLSNAEKIFIAIQHHPEHYLHLDEHDERIGSFNYIKKKCHFLFMGHEHNPKPELVGNNVTGSILHGGATYETEIYDNNCTILQLNRTRGRYQARKLTWNCNEWIFHEELIGQSHFPMPIQPSPNIAESFDEKRPERKKNMQMRDDF